MLFSSIRLRHISGIFILFFNTSQTLLTTFPCICNYTASSLVLFALAFALPYFSDASTTVQDVASNLFIIWHKSSTLKLYFLRFRIIVINLLDCRRSHYTTIVGKVLLNVIVYIYCDRWCTIYTLYTWVKKLSIC